MPKTKLTGFSRLLLFLLFFVPIAYVGASYYNGEDPIANIKVMLGVEETTAPVSVEETGSTSSSPATAPATFENVQDLRNENARLKRDLAIANEKLARCQTDNVE
ncbi:MAG: hypothetical protein AAGA31_00845 [Bacteroidota bacterium]